MANRYPLVIDTLDANKIKELQTGDNLNLADNNIVGVQNITALGTIEAAVLTVNGNRVVAQNFTQLSDTPNSYTGNANNFVSVNEAGTGLQFKPLSAFGTIDVANDSKETIVTCCGPFCDLTRKHVDAAKQIRTCNACKEQHLQNDAAAYV